MSSEGRGATPEPDEYLVARLQDAFMRDERVAEPSITVTLVEDNVYLGGTVATRQRREALERIARELCPQRRIHNEVTVSELPDTPAVEDLH
jgi:osmotically-inducible protein OsmY